MVVDGVTLKMDADVYEFLKDKRVEINASGYPQVRLHTMFFSKREATVIDHINRDKCDFRRSNLREASFSTNNRNRSRSASAAAPYRGLKRQKSGVWAAEIFIGGKSVFLGRYVAPEDAARAYDIACLYFHPEMDVLNFPAADYADLAIAEEIKRIIFRRPRNNSSGYRGVFKSKSGKRWCARYGRLPDGRPRHLGTFATAEEAAAVRDAFARQQGIRNTRLNTPDWEAFLERHGYPATYTPPICCGADSSV